MNYELPDNLKTYIFFCENAMDIASYRRCKKRCPDTYRECWKRHLREDLRRDCEIENEFKVAGHVRCYKCGDICDIHFPPNRFMCDKCDCIVYCGTEEQKQLLGDDFLELDERELSDALAPIK